MIAILISILSILILAFSIFDFNKSVGLFLIYKILVPMNSLYIFGFMLGNNLIVFYLLALFILMNSKFSFDFKTLMPFFFLYLAQGVLIPFHTDLTPVAEQLTLFRVNVMSLFLPFLVVNIIKKDPKQYRFFFYCLMAAIIVSVVYGASLLLNIGSNFYLDEITKITGDEFHKFTFTEDFRFFGYLSSVFPDVGTYGTLLIMSFLFAYLQRRNTHRMIWSVLLGLVLVGVLFCGSRSVLFAVFGVYVFYLLIRGNYRLTVRVSLVVLIIAVIVLMVMPKYTDFVMSISRTDVQGSTTDMRWIQLNGCFEELANSPLVGNGYGWTSYYNSQYGNHPTMLSFESLLIQVLCNNGILGLIIWISAFVYVSKLIKNTFSKQYEERYVLLSMVVGFLFYAMFTADYGSIVLLFYFYCIVMASSYAYKAKLSVRENASLVINTPRKAVQ